MFDEQACSQPILLVEDDADIRSTVRDILEARGYVVHEAFDGRHALDVLATMERPCLILLDMMMPVMDGATFLSSMRKNDDFTGIPVVLVTASSIRDAGEVAVLKKPFEYRALLQTVEQHC